jgi:hypothetical protein
LIAAGLASDADPDEAVRAGNHLTRRVGRHEDVLARAELVLGALDADLPVTTHDDVDLFLSILPMVVDGARGVRRQLQLVEPKGRHPERVGDWAESALDPDVTPLRDIVSLDLVRADDLRIHASFLSALGSSARR